MNCQDTATHLPDYLGDELDPTLRTSLEAHLACCSTCAEEVAELRSVADGLRNSAAVPLSDALRSTDGLRVTRRPTWFSIGLAGLRYAAVLVIGVWLGMSVAAPGDSPAHLPEPIADSSSEEQSAAFTSRLALSESEFHPGWIELAREVGPERGSDGATLGRHLSVLARIGKAR
jgi:anti-sigma factor RsiW